MTKLEKNSLMHAHLSSVLNDDTESGNQRFQIVSSRSSSPTLKVVADDGCEKFLHSSYDPIMEARERVTRFTFCGQGIIVVLGLGLGYHVVELASRFPQTKILIIEAHPECERLVRLHKTVDINQEHLIFLTGLDQSAALQKITEQQLEAGMPPLTLFILPSSVAAFPDYYQPLQNKLVAGNSLNLAGLLRYSKFQESSRRVLLFDCGYFLYREVASTLERLGHQVERIYFTEKTPVSQLMASLIKSIARFHPDFCLTINHLGFDEEGTVAQFLSSIEMPSASWFVDSPDLIIKGFSRNVSSFSAIFVWDRSYLASMRKIGFEVVEYLPLGTDPLLFRPIKNTSPIVAGLAAQVGFVGDSMTMRLQNKLNKICLPLHALTEKLARQLSSQRATLEEVVTTLDFSERLQLSLLGVRERQYFDAAVTWQATLFYRHACIEQLRSFRPVIRGDQGWQALLNSDFSLCSPLDYYRELPFFYNACTVNFNATNLQMRTAVNQRLFDVPACGSFILTDHQESLGEFFTIGNEVVTFQDQTEIPGLVRFYIDNPCAREKVARRGRERVLRQHTYRHRIQSLIETMTTCYS